MQKESIKFQSSTVLEGMTSLRALFTARADGINDRPIKRVLFNKDKTYREWGYLRAMASEHDFLLEGVSTSKIDELALGNTHGGIIAECGERTLPLLQSSLSAIQKQGFYAMIQGIEDPYNFGYALRSLYACGVNGIILSERNWLSAAGVVARASAGASERLAVYVADPAQAASLFHEIGYSIVCADERTNNVLHTTSLKMPLLLIVGGERRGISRNLLDQADIVVKIPYGRDFAASLSAASATTILGYEIMRQNS